MRQALLPVPGDPAAVVGQRIDVPRQAERHDVGVQPVDHRARLFAGTAMRLLDDDVLPGLALPVTREGLVELDLQLLQEEQGEFGIFPVLLGDVLLEGVMVELPFADELLHHRSPRATFLTRTRSARNSAARSLASTPLIQVRV